MRRQPRSSGKRVTLMVLLVLGASSLAALADLVIHVRTFTIGDESVSGLVVLVVVYGFLATRVSLPWYYALWLLVPFVGLYALWKISWRVAYLPWRDWALRPGEARSEFDVMHDVNGVHERMVQVRKD